jgi:hypothetical protein
MPGSTPATSQLDWLISITAIIVLFWSRATRDLLKACPGAGRGRSAGASRHSIGYMQRRSCHFLAARPIASPGPTSSPASNEAFYRVELYIDTGVSSVEDESHAPVIVELKLCGRRRGKH